MNGIVGQPEDYCSSSTEGLPQRCPQCGRELLGVQLRGPTDRRAVPCGHLIGDS
jgi:hypothetical protein